MTRGVSWRDVRSFTWSPAQRRLGSIPALERLALAAEAIACTAGALFVLAYLFIAVHRLAFPFDLEWMEGAMVQHASRVLAGQALYGRPTLDYTPFLYPPLYYYVSAAVARITGIGFLPLRLVSFASSLVVFWFMYLLAEAETQSRYAGFLACGLFAATFRISGAWWDLARNDSLFFALLLASIYLVRFNRSYASWACAGLLLALSALTKQTTVFIAVPILLYAAIVDWRKASVLTPAFAALLGGVTLAYNIRDHGWFLYYVLRLPEHIQHGAAEHPRFLQHDLLAAMPIASVLGVATLVTLRPWRDRGGAFWLLFTVGVVGGAWISRLHSGAYDNVLIPAYACLALLTAIASRRLPALFSARRAPLARLAVAVLCVQQLHALRYHVYAQIPTADDVEIARELGQRITEAGGEVLVPFHSFVPTPRGPVMHAHSWAVFDVLRGGDYASRWRLASEIRVALDVRRYNMIVVDKVEPWMQPGLDDGYTRSTVPIRQDGLWTRTGYRTHPSWIFVPR